MRFIENNKARILQRKVEMGRGTINEQIKVLTYHIQYDLLSSN